jgi:hypothetical protein
MSKIEQSLKNQNRRTVSPKNRIKNQAMRKNGKKLLKAHWKRR